MDGSNETSLVDLVKTNDAPTPGRLKNLKRYPFMLLFALEMTYLLNTPSNSLLTAS